MKNEPHIPPTQTAVQLTGPDELSVTDNKQVLAPGPYQILCKTEAVGLCYSDLKLLKQFDSHPRKGEVVSGLDDETLKEIPSYVPDKSPTVPGHETVVRVCAVGEKVKHIKTQQRYLVQSDYRWIRTAHACAAFGYNFEGGLQEYVLLDERVCTSPQGESMMIPVGDELSASALALVEPWACVEHAYVTKDRRAIKTNGRMLVVADLEIDPKVFSDFLKRYSKRCEIIVCDRAVSLSGLDTPVRKLTSLEQAGESAFDDVIYFGSNVQRAEALFHKVATNGLYNIVQCGSKFTKDVTTSIGRIHYGNIRLIGTTSSDPSQSMKRIPKNGEIRAGDKIHIIGAAGPMGTMHVIRVLSAGIQDVEVHATDLDENRSQILRRLAQPIALNNGVEFQAYHSNHNHPGTGYDYIVLLVPSADMAAETLHTVAPGAMINLFAGIPAEVSAKVDLNTYIEKGLYFIGTSGSTLGDMKQVLQKVNRGQLDTNVSVAAVCGLTCAAQGIRAIEKQQIPGKIIVYPQCRELDLLTLDQLKDKIPRMKKQLQSGQWNARAEDELLSIYT